MIKTKAKIVEIIQETPNVKTFRLKPEEKIEFKPSQFIIVEIKCGEEIVKRSYSIASSPTKDYIEVGFNLHPDGKLTPTFYSMKVGDVIDISGPYGGFVLDESLKDVVFISGGTGITPLMGMMRTALEKGLDMKMDLIYSAKTEKDVIYKKELEEIASSGKAKIHITLTREESDRLLELNEKSSQRGFGYHSGRIDAGYIKECVPDLQKPTFYICGPKGLIEGTVNALNEIGVPKEHIKREAW